MSAFFVPVETKKGVLQKSSRKGGVAKVQSDKANAPYFFYMMILQSHLPVSYAFC